MFYITSQETEQKPLYFARKFEAIINQEVINQLEMVVFDKTQGMIRYVIYFLIVFAKIMRSLMD